MKAMKLYDGVNRIYRELAAAGIGPEHPLTVADLTPFDQYHYHGTLAVDAAIAAAGIRPGSRVLDIGAGIGGPARYIAHRTGAQVTALELQHDLSETGADLTRRCGLAGRVEHVQGNVLDGVSGTYDAIVSMLCFLHIPDRARLFAVCRTALRPGGVLFIEDYGKHREPSTAEAAALAGSVQCPYLPTQEDYREHILAAGFPRVSITDVTEDWTGFTAARLTAYRQRREHQTALHGASAVAGLEDFYATVSGLFASGLIAGLKITTA